MAWSRVRIRFTCVHATHIRLGPPRAILGENLGVPVYVPDDPLTAVVRGTGMILEELDAYHEALITQSHELSPTE